LQPFLHYWRRISQWESLQPEHLVKRLRRNLSHFHIDQVDFKIAMSANCFNMCPNRSTMSDWIYMKVLCLITLLCNFVGRASRSCVRYTISLLVYFGSILASPRSICGLCKGSEWLYSRDLMLDRWWSMTIVICLNISVEDVIMQTYFLIKRLHRILHF